MADTIANWVADPSSVSKKYADLVESSMWNLIRRERDELLASCDWTQMPDSQLSESKKTEWATYRQELRDLPTSQTPTMDENQIISEVIYPTVPE